MPIHRRNLLSVVAAGSPFRPSPAPSVRRVAGATRSRGRIAVARQARRQGHGGGVLLAHLHPLRRLRAGTFPQIEVRADRYRQAALGLPRLPAGPGGADGGDGRPLPAAGSLRAFRHGAVRQPGPLGLRPAASTPWTNCGRLAALAGMSRATFDTGGHRRRAADLDLAAAERRREEMADRLDSELRDQRQEIRRRDELRRVRKLLPDSLGTESVVAGQLPPACASPDSRASPSRPASRSCPA